MIPSKVTNRMLAEATGYSLTQYRRWVVALLPPDPHVGQFAGISREHSLDDAFQLFLGGTLVEQYGLKIEDASIVMKEILRILKERKLLPSDFITDRVVTPTPVYTLLRFGKNRKGRFRYELKTVWFQKNRHDEKVGKDLIVEEYEVKDFGDKRLLNELPTVLHLEAAVREFVEDLKEYFLDLAEKE